MPKRRTSENGPLPWRRHYPAERAANKQLRCCSLAARGLYDELRDIAHASQRFGYLLINDKPPTATQLVAIIGASLEEITRLRDELDENGLLPRDRDGVVYFADMVIGERDRLAAITNGKLGGNPALTHSEDDDISGGVNPGDKPPLKPRVRVRVRGKEGETHPSAHPSDASPPGAGGDDNDGNDDPRIWVKDFTPTPDDLQFLRDRLSRFAKINEPVFVADFRNNDEFSDTVERMSAVHWREFVELCYAILVRQREAAE